MSTNIKKRKDRTADNEDVDDEIDLMDTIDQTTTNTTTSRTSILQSCPYLDTIQRSVLDFDMEPTCQVSLESGPHIYACLICGSYFRGRGVHTPAYTHAVETSHYVFVHLSNYTFHCIPDDIYDMNNPKSSDMATLKDIKDALNPICTIRDVMKLDQKNTDINSINDNNNNVSSNATSEKTISSNQQQVLQNQQVAQPAIVSRDLFGRRYIPGFVGLSNLNKTDCINSVVQALAHVKPIRDYFLLQLHHVNNGHSADINRGNANNNRSNKSAELVTNAFGELVRQLWSPYRFKSHIDPHILVNAIIAASNKRFKVGIQSEAGELMAWLLHQLHIGTMIEVEIINNKKKKTKTKKKVTSIIEQTFQGKVRVTTKEIKRKKKEKDENDTYRVGSDSENDIDDIDMKANSENGITSNGNGNQHQHYEIEETIITTKFLQLTLEIPKKPLFRDEDGGLVIPQEPLLNVLKKVDGKTYTDNIISSANYNPCKKKYELLLLPNYIILHLTRFTKNEYSGGIRRDKNPSIVIFPVKNLDLSSYVITSLNNTIIPSPDDIHKMSVSILLSCLLSLSFGEVL